MTLSSILSSPYRMFSPRDQANDEEDTGARIVTEDGRALPLRSAMLRAECGGGLARVVLEQTFENPYHETLHVTYKMPLPADGAVSGYEFTVGPRTIKGRVESKEAAREQFEQAIASGKTAGLLEQQRADIFTQEIGNIPAGEAIIARITVDQKLRWLPEGEWELRFPTVIGPRYVGAEVSEGDARAVHVAVAGKDETRARIHLEVHVNDEITEGRRAESPSHRISETTPRKYVLSSANDGAKLDRDIVVRWAVAAQTVGLSLAMARPGGKEPHGHVAYGLLTIVPPSPKVHHEVAPRDLIVLLDTSGSMGGPPLAQAKKVIALMIDALSPHDRLEIIEFSSTANAWQRDPMPATPDTKKNAISWLKKLEAGGATEMHSAIMRALRALRPGAQRQVVLVTDGYIGGEQQVVDLLHERLPPDCRMHVVGVGSAVNRSLATAIARAGRGAEVLVGLDEDAERPARRLLDRTVAPILTDVTVEGSAVVEIAPQHVPDVFAGSPLVCGVKLAPEGGEMIVSGKLAGGTWERKVRVPAMSAGEGDQAIVALFAREHVADLEMRWTIGRETALIDRTIEKVGVVFQIATRRTSWVAIDDVVSVDPKSGARQVAQPQELPYGTSMQSFFGPPGGGGGLGVTRAGTISPMAMQLVKTLSAAAAPAPPRPSMSYAQPQAQGFGGVPMAGPLGGAPPAEAREIPPASMAGMSIPSAPMKRRRSLWMLLIVLLLLALVAFAAWFIFIRPS